jgi:hypothetical protein
MAALFLVLGGLALGDIIHTKDGSKIEGDILSESGDNVVVKTSFGKIEIPKAQIQKIERAGGSAKGGESGGKSDREGGRRGQAGEGAGGDNMAGMVEQKLGVRPKVVSSEHFRIITMFEEEEAKVLTELAEQVHSDFTELIEEREGRRYWPLLADEFFLSDREMYVEFMRKIMPSYVNSKQAIDFWIKQKGSAISSFPPVGVAVRKNVPLRNSIVHHAAKHLIRHYVGPRKQLAAWITEGFGYYIEFKYEKAARVIVQTDKMYGGDTKVANKDSDSSTWPELVKTGVIDGTLMPFDKLKHRFVNEMDYSDLAKSWSLMTFLIDEHEEKFVEWVKNMRKMMWEEAMYKAYRWTNAELDREWGLWVKAVY